MATNEKSSAVLTDAEIKKALECCPQDNPNHNCARCAYKPIEGFCFDYLMKDALDLINRLEADKEALVTGQETLQKSLAEKNAEIEYLRKEYVPMLERNLKETDKLGIEYMLENARLLKENQILSTNADTAFQDGLNEAQDLYAEQIRKEIKAKAIKEFAERLKKDIQDHSFEMFMNGLKGTPRTNEITYETVWEYIDNLLKEMVGDAK